MYRGEAGWATAHFSVMVVTQHVASRQAGPGAHSRVRRPGARPSLCEHDRLAWAAAAARSTWSFWPCVATPIFVS